MQQTIKALCVAILLVLAGCSATVLPCDGARDGGIGGTGGCATAAPNL